MNEGHDTSRCALAAGSVVSDAVRRYLDEQLRCFRYWCVAGPGGCGWHKPLDSQFDEYHEIRDYLEKVCGEPPESDPYFDKRTPNTKISNAEPQTQPEERTP